MGDVDWERAVRKLGAQLVVLTAKNWLILWRRKVSWFIRQFLPAATVILVLVLKNTVYEYADWEPYRQEDGMPVELELPKCSVFQVDSGKNLEKHRLNLACATLAFTPDTDERVVQAMRRLADRHRFEYGTDVVGFSNATALAAHIFNHPGSVDAAAVFDNGASPNYAWDYQLWHNHSSGPTTNHQYAYGTTGLDPLYAKYSIRGRLPALQKAINDALISLDVASSGKPNKNAASVGITFAPYPKDSLVALPPPPPDQDDVDETLYVHPPSMVVFLGALMIMCGTTSVSILTLTSVVDEKRTRILGHLRSMGMSEAMYWLSWVLVLFPLGFVQALIAVTVGQLTGLWVFTKCSFGVHVVALMLYDWALASLALCFAAACKRPMWVNNLAFQLFAATLVTQIVFVLMSYDWEFKTGLVAGLWDGMYHSNTAPFGRFAIQLLPWFHYGRIFSSVLEKTTFDETKWKGRARAQRFEWEDLYPRKNWTAIAVAHGFDYGDCDFQPKTADAWLTGGMLPGSSRCNLVLRYNGSDAELDLEDTNALSDALNNNLTYAGFRIKRQLGSNTFADMDDAEPVGTSLDMLVMNVALYLTLAWYLGQVLASDQGAARVPWFFLTREYWVGAAPPREFMPGDTLANEQRASEVEGSIRLHKMSMAFDQVTAVKELSLVMNAREVFCLLGQNGAGKSTAINVMTGLLTPTHGEAFVCGADLRTSVAQIRETLGVCPQDNVLFRELTAEEHLWFYACFKGQSLAEARTYATYVLERLGLSKDAGRLVDQFSGGMQRRLSFALATTGHPKALFLDEPTTGLDPLSRRKVWSLVEELKADRIVVLTTHSMEEADALGDTIALMSLGRLRAIGTSTFLKERYGSGYQITLLVDSNMEEEVCAAVQQRLPGAEISQVGGGSLTISLPRKLIGHMGRLRVSALSRSALRADSFFEWIKTPEGKAAVREWGLSNTTLEEVFVRLAVQNKEVNAPLGPPTGAELASGDAHVQMLSKELEVSREEKMTLTMAVLRVLELMFNTAREPSLSELKTEAMPLLPLVNATELMPEVAPVAQESNPTYTVIPEVAKAPETSPNTGRQAAEPVSVVTANPSPPAPPSISLPEPHTQRSSMVPAHEGDGFVGGLELNTKQIRAILLRNASYQAKQRKSNCCVGCVLVLLVLMNLLVALGPGASSNNWRPELTSCEHYPGMYRTPSSGNCSEAQFVDQLVLAAAKASKCYDQIRAFPPACVMSTPAASSQDCCSAYVQLSAEFQLADCPCEMWYQVFGDLTNIDAWKDTCEGLDPNKLLYCDRHKPEPAIYYDDYMGRAEPFRMPSATLEKTLNVHSSDPSMWLESSHWPSSEALRNTRNGSNYKEAHLWFEDAPGGATSLSEYDLLGLGKGVLTAPGLVQFRHVQSAISKVLENEAELQMLNSERFPANSTCLSPYDYYADNGYPTDFPEVPAVPDTVEYDPGDTSSSKGYDGSGNAYDSYDPYEYRYYPYSEQGWVLDSQEQAYKELRDMLPDATINLLRSDPAGGVLDWKVSAYTYSGRECVKCKSFSDQNRVCTEFSISSSTVNDQSLVGLVDGMSNAMFHTVQQQAKNDFTGFRTVLVEMPELGFWHQSADPMDSFQPFPHMLFLVATLCLLHTQVSVMVEEFHSGLFHMMTMMGLVQYVYWTALYLWNILLFGSVGGFFVMIGGATGLPFYKDVEPGFWVAVLLLGVHCQIGYAVLLSSILRSARSATAVTIIWVIFLVTICSGLLEWVNPWPPILQLIPLYGYAYVSALVMAYKPDSVSNTPDHLAEAFGLAFASGTMTLAVGLAILTIYPTKLASQSEGLLDVVNAAVKARFPARKAKGWKPNTSSSSDDSEARITVNVNVGDADVIAEEEAVINSWTEVSRNSAIAIRGLMKQFPGKPPAVKGITLKVNTGECFGLLGPNGAGKTTLINILAGSMNASEGEATIAGFNIRSERKQIYSKIGICPQFDIIWSDLTVQEHLLLYARLNGVSPSVELPRVRQVAEQMELDGDAFKQKASTLSGGMRRRLSIGIALIADPKVLFLDEPTTGLDPETRQQIWKAIDRVKEGRAIVLTTHSMEEADALTTRIGIMAAGELLCLGSQLRLKNLYGDGLQLKVTLESNADSEVVERFVRGRVCDTVRTLSSPGQRNQVYILVRQMHAALPHIFRIMENESHSVGIREWSITQTSLEDVFINLVNATQAS